MFDAVVTAGGRLDAQAARRYGTAVKALVRVDGRPLLDCVIGSLRAVESVRRIVVVGPREARAHVGAVDEWIDEKPTGEENLLAALRAGETERVVFSASDLPFVAARSFQGLIDRTTSDAGAVYPVYRKHDFLRAYPAGRARFAKLADGEWTGGSAFVLARAPLLANTALLERGFAARKRLTALAALLGPSLLLRFVLGRVTIADVEQRASSLLGARMQAVEGCDPALAMDLDDVGDFAYAHAEEGAAR